MPVETEAPKMYNRDHCQHNPNHYNHDNNLADKVISLRYSSPSQRDARKLDKTSHFTLCILLTCLFTLAKYFKYIYGNPHIFGHGPTVSIQENYICNYTLCFQIKQHNCSKQEYQTMLNDMLICFFVYFQIRHSFCSNNKKKHKKIIKKSKSKILFFKLIHS